MKSIMTLLILLGTNIIVIAQSYGSWTETGSLNTARVNHAIVVLPDGKVLVSGNDVDSIQSSCEIYDITTEKWSYITPMNVPRALHNLVLLSTGKVLAIAGLKERSCEIFNPVTETWSMTDSIPTFRYFGQSVTTLTDGKVLVAGGMFVDTVSWNIVVLNNLDIYNPQTAKWTEAAHLNLRRYGHTATLLDDGRVLVTGGTTENLQTEECEIYDPSNNTWTVSSSMLEKRWDHSAILLNNGNVFVSGGNPIFPWLKSCEVYDLNTNQWFSVADMLAYRTGHRIYYLTKIDKLLILGGDAQPVTTEDTWEIYDPISLVPLYEEPFPINQFLVDNNVQLVNGDIFVSGNEEYEVPPGGLPYRWPSKRSWIFDVVTNVAEDNNHHIEDFLLEQNYPNPFNPATTISYTLHSYVNVELKVYDVLGNEIETLVNMRQPAGTYHINFDASGSSTGIYYYRLTISNDGLSAGKTFQQTKKMVLIR